VEEASSLSIAPDAGVRGKSNFSAAISALNPW